MGVPLTTLTQKPVQYDVTQFGRDDTKFEHTGLFGTIVQWDANAKDDVFKANFVFIMKQAFAFLDKIGIGTCIYGEGGFKDKIREYEIQLNNHPRFCERFLERNRLARLQIVYALGGEEFCKTIPVVDPYPSWCLTSSLMLDEQYFAKGEYIVQGEDAAGRKFVILRLRNTTHISSNGPALINHFPVVVTVHQQRRETDSAFGDKWSLRCRNYAYRDVGTDAIAKLIADARAGRGQFLFSPKP